MFLDVDETDGEDLDDDVEDLRPVNGFLLFVHNELVFVGSRIKWINLILFNAYCV